MSLLVIYLIYSSVCADQKNLAGEAHAASTSHPSFYQNTSKGGDALFSERAEPEPEQKS